MVKKMFHVKHLSDWLAFTMFRIFHNEKRIYEKIQMPGDFCDVSRETFFRLTSLSIFNWFYNEK